MLKKIFTLLLLFSLSFSNQIDGSELSGIPAVPIERQVSVIFRNNGIDIDSKSIKGWIRIFKSRDKLMDYNIYVEEKERKVVLLYLRKRYNNKMSKYKRGL